MPQLSLSIKYSKNSGRIFSPAEVKAIYLYGIKITSTDGSRFSDDAFRFYIDESQRTIQNMLGIKIEKQMIEESSSYYRDSYWNGFPVIKTNFIVNEPLSMTGLLRSVEQVMYPREWLSCAHKPNSIGSRRISIVPTGSSNPTSGDMILTGIVTQLGIQRFENIPDYWRAQYTTGFDIDNLPFDIMGVIGKMSCFGPLNVAGDLILGSAGIAFQSLAIDGLSQSISTTSSATNAGYGARLINYQKEIEDTMKNIKSIYKSLQFEVV